MCNYAPIMAICRWEVVAGSELETGALDREFSEIVVFREVVSFS